MCCYDVDDILRRCIVWFIILCYIILWCTFFILIVVVVTTTSNWYYCIIIIIITIGTSISRLCRRRLFRRLPIPVGSGCWLGDTVGSYVVGLEVTGLKLETWWFGWARRNGTLTWYIDWT